MKKLITFFAALCLCLLLVPVTAEAQEVTSKYFTVDVEVGNHGSIAPGDTFTETFEIKNTAAKEITVRLYSVTNIDNSKLFPVIRANFDVVGESTQKTNLDKLKTNWYTLKAGKSMEMDLSMLFPPECGNEYQGAALKARFTFEVRIPSDDTTGGANISTHPKTGDTANIPLWSCLAAVSGGAALIFLFFLCKKQKQEN